MTKEELKLFDRIESQIGAKMQVVQEDLEDNHIVAAIDDIRSARGVFAELCDKLRTLHKNVDNN